MYTGSFKRHSLYGVPIILMGSFWIWVMKNETILANFGALIYNF